MLSLNLLHLLLFFTAQLSIVGSFRAYQTPKILPRRVTTHPSSSRSLSRLQQQQQQQHASESRSRTRLQQHQQQQQHASESDLLESFSRAAANVLVDEAVESSRLNATEIRGKTRNRGFVTRLMNRSAPRREQHGISIMSRNGTATGNETSAVSNAVAVQELTRGLDFSSGAWTISNNPQGRTYAVKKRLGTRLMG